MEKPRIALIEDNEFNHELYQKTFEKAGFEVALFPNADGDFVERIVALKPDIISMDLMIGLSGAPAERDGFSAIKLLKADARTAPIPIFVLTSFSAEEKVAEAKTLGAVDFISTPSQTFSKIPDYFINYLRDPRHHTPLHPLFRN